MRGSRLHGLNRAKELLLASTGIAALVATVVFGFGHAPAVSAQSRASEKPFTFDVSSIKPINKAAESLRSGPGLRFLPGRVESLPAGVTAKQLIAEAFQMTEQQLGGGPSWIGSDRFTLEAKTDHADRNEIRMMLQTLLSERFKLVASQGTKLVRVYALTVRKGGPGPARYQVKEETQSAGSAGFHKAEPGFEGHTGGRATPFMGTMEFFARSLSDLRRVQPDSPLLDRPVVDRTGLPGVFSFRLAWNDDEDLMSALQDELGLRLESQQAEMAVLTIDRIEKPNGN